MVTQISEIHQAVAKPPQKGSPTWANIAAQNRAPLPPFRGLNRNPHLPPKKPNEEITIRPAEANEELRGAATPTEILRNLSSALGRACPVAARRLRSGDIRVTLQNKKYALTNRESIQHQLGATILREEFPVEVMAVPRSLPIQEGKLANNNALFQNLKKANLKRIPGLNPIKAHWIPRPKHAQQQQPTKTRSSLILCVDSVAEQHNVVRQGLVIEGQIYQARIYDYALSISRCYRCSRWGHAQTRCPAKDPACGHCGRDHLSRDCPDTAQKYCVNCRSRTHKAWDGKDCTTFQSLKQRREELRLDLHYQSDELRATPARATSFGEIPFETPQAGEKRKPYTPATTLPRKQGVGRPSFSEPSQALRDASQSTLSWSTPGQATQISQGSVSSLPSQSTPDSSTPFPTPSMAPPPPEVIPATQHPSAHGDP